MTTTTIKNTPKQLRDNESDNDITVGIKSNKTEIGTDRIVDNQKDSINVNNIKGVKPNTAGVNT